MKIVQKFLVIEIFSICFPCKIKQKIEEKGYLERAACSSRLTMFLQKKFLLYGKISETCEKTLMME